MRCACAGTARVTYPNDRRKSQRDSNDDDALSPEYMAMLVACGGDVRAGDRAALPERAIERRLVRRVDDAAPVNPLLPRKG